MLVLILSMCMYAYASTQCHPVKCATDTSKFASNDCYVFENDAYNLRLCPDGDFCTPINSAQTATPPGTCADPGPQQGPNESCTSKSDCIVSTSTKGTVACTNGFCTGYLKDGATCVANTDCSYTSYCDKDNKTCTSVSNDRTCYTFENNPAGNTCEQNMGCVDGQCVPYFSRKPGESCFIWADCETYSCDQTALKCNYTAPVSKNKAPHTCDTANAATDCVTKSYMNYENKSATMNTNCLCGISKSGNAYCQQTSGDDDWQEWAKVSKKWIAGNISKCSPERKWVSNCVGSHGGQLLMEEFRYYGWKLQVAETTDYDNCGGTMYYGEYEDAKKYLEDYDDDDSDDDFGVILPLIGALMLY